MGTHKDAGYITLQSIKVADKFNRWMYDSIKEDISGNILEIGSGIGNISQFFLNKGAQITLSDLEEDYLLLLQEQFRHYPNAKGFLKIDLADPNFENKYFSFKESFDSVFMLNVLEHIEKDEQAIRNCHYLLKPKGTLVILVPAYMQLYSSFDRQIGHYRRYTIKSLKATLPSDQFLIERSFYFNALGIAGWLWNKISNKKEIEEGKMELFNKLVPLARVLDKILLNKLGLSAIVVARKH